MKMAFVKISLVLVAVLLGLYSASTYASSVTVWSADMEVVDYQNGAIGAPLASLFSNQGGTGGLTAVRLWYYGPARRLYLAFVSPVFNTAGLTLNAGDLVIAFQEDDSGDSSWTWEDVDAPGWTDGETIQARLVRSGSSESADATDASRTDTDVAQQQQVVEPTTIVGSDATDTPVSPTDTPEPTAICVSVPPYWYLRFPENRFLVGEITWALGQQLPVCQRKSWWAPSSTEGSTQQGRKAMQLSYVWTATTTVMNGLQFLAPLPTFGDVVR